MLSDIDHHQNNDNNIQSIDDLQHQNSVHLTTNQSTTNEIDQRFLQGFDYKIYKIHTKHNQCNLCYYISFKRTYISLFNLYN